MKDANQKTGPTIIQGNVRAHIINYVLFLHKSIDIGRFPNLKKKQQQCSYN